MANVNQKYLKDENNNIISPVTSLDSVYTSSGGGVINYIIGLIYPVGSIYISIKNTNPGTYITGTTWVAWGSGRVPVGVNSGDTNFNTVEKTGGESTHTLTVNEIPSHRHALTENEYGMWANYNATGILGTYQSSGANCHFSTVKTDNTGGGTSHNNLQPYITCYMWKRTA